MKVLRRTQFGNPILREKARQLRPQEIASAEIQELIANMRHTLISQKLGIGLAAPQIEKSLALTVIAIRPLAHRHKVTPFDLVLINPEITERMGKRKALWEGCISSSRGGRADLFAKVPRYPKVKVKYYDEKGHSHHQEFSDFKAQIIQHEVDHLNGVLFVDHVEDPKTFMSYQEYMRLMRRHLKDREAMKGV